MRPAGLLGPAPPDQHVMAEQRADQSGPPATPGRCRGAVRPRERKRTPRPIAIGGTLVPGRERSPAHYLAVDFHHDHRMPFPMLAEPREPLGLGIGLKLECARRVGAHNSCKCRGSRASRRAPRGEFESALKSTRSTSEQEEIQTSSVLSLTPGSQASYRSNIPFLITRIVYPSTHFRMQADRECLPVTIGDTSWYAIEAGLVVPAFAGPALR